MEDELLDLKLGGLRKNWQCGVGVGLWVMGYGLVSSLL